eukprot:CAMPEP_0183354724 /NCGR_PEP_ID=MMETSP0164_2-20130417/37935_1 /TAXON_ID=221442 /ORGANISM="Coccolithus pelagicus ssp braarudi, Strain PLY182g" /LENGTH=126 /DNA_ID=CAMNT_0025527663 /DNA_START=168 /DNA_END=549 /DNA_ORIENTATION=-
MTLKPLLCVAATTFIAPTRQNEYQIQKGARHPFRFQVHAALGPHAHITQRRRGGVLQPLAAQAAIKRRHAARPSTTEQRAVLKSWCMMECFLGKGTDMACLKPRISHGARTIELAPPHDCERTSHA